MPAFLVGSGHEVVGLGNGVIHDHNRAGLASDGRTIARNHAGCSNLLVMRGSQAVGLGCVLELVLLNIHVSAYDSHNQLVLFLSGLVIDERAHHEQRLGCLSGRDVEKPAEILDCLCIGSCHQLLRLGFLCEVFLAESGHLTVGRVSAVPACDDGVLSDG